ncbi:PREDICTED: uncharacterized protein LOC108359232, partial [Rhagoletis zephyria]|uniref:uncharacterized protein LOC108359232 n=1 Tax=Rhagoletis zephyria TaxID=28612 RepID=UPI0008113B97
MLLLIALLHNTATTTGGTHQKREYRVTRRFIEIGSEQAFSAETIRESVSKGSKIAEWHIEGVECRKGKRVLRENKNAEEAPAKEKTTPCLNGSKILTATRATQLSIDTNQLVREGLFANVSSAKNLTPALEDKKPGSAVHDILKHQIVLDVKPITNSKILHKTPAPATTIATFSLRLKNAHTSSHINYPPPSAAISPLSHWPALRFKRQQAALPHKTQQLSALQSSSGTAAHYNPLPAVPLPTPPPFPGNFAISPFSGGGGGGGGGGAKHISTGGNVLNAFAGFSSASSAFSATHRTNSLCGGILKSRYGTIQTPNFPHKFSAPIECVWVIDASELPITTSAAAAVGGGGGGTNVSIIVYLTQLYVLGGLKFTEYMYYSDDYKVPAHRVFTLTEDDVTQVAWVQFSSQYLEIRFTMASLDGTHLRALDRLLDVYGFNITYEVQQQVKTYQCNTLQCRFLGHCYAKADYSSYYCSCFPGFSGTDCGRGPLCEDPHTNICQNGGTCKHIGDAAITCHCPSGFKGTKCEIPEINEITMGCTSNSTTSDCHKECDFDRVSEGITLRKASKMTARNGKTRYEVTIRLGANLTAFYRNMDPERRPSDHLPSLLERHLMRVLRNFNITKISDLELISNSTDRLDITFHFFGVKGDSNRIREAITRMVERGRIGNITLVSNYHLFDENPPLNLLELTINQKSAIREDSEFIISCTAQGSSRMQFQWYKDGARVNTSKATREIWTTVLPPETKDTFTAILGITKANRMDEGIYTCKVTDWGVEQCRSLHVHIKIPPRLRVDPASVTLQRGDSLRVRCLSPGNDDIKRYAQLGYSWTRNGVLFQSNPATVMWEDLYPDGSILKINNIQKSAEYTCIVSNTVRPVSKSVYITVIDRNAVHVCHSAMLYGVRWPTSAPGAAIVADCPRGFEGHSRRICESRDTGNSTWLLPDFSLCVHDQLLAIYNKFRALSAGYQQTNSSAILKACFEYTVKRHKRFLPGEAGFLIDMLHEVDTYLQLKGTQLEREMAAEIILHILDKVMQNTQSLNSQQQIKKLQLLTQSAALNRETIAASQLATSTSSTSAAASQPISPTQRPLFVIISCACGLLQSCSAFLILLPIWFNRKCAITFLKMQFCISTSSIMIIYLLGFLKMLPVNWQAIVNSSLASLLLLGVSTTIAIALVVNSELVPKKMLHINKMSATAATSGRTITAVKKEHQHQQQRHRHEMNKRRNSTSGNDNGNGANVTTANASATTIDATSLSATTNITQISSSDAGGGNVASNDNSIANDTSTVNRRVGGGSVVVPARSVARVQELYFPVSVRAVIGISWLPPLLYAITVPLICSIIGKWPRNWWLEVMSNTTADATRTTTTTSYSKSGGLLGMHHGLSTLVGGYGSGGGGGSDYLVEHMSHSPPPSSSLSLKVEPNNISSTSHIYDAMMSTTTTTSTLEAESVTAADATAATAAVATGILTTTSSATATSDYNQHSSTYSSSSANFSTSTAISTTFSVAGWHNNFQPAAISASSSVTAAAYRSEFFDVNADAADAESNLDGGGGGGGRVASLNFIIFICVDLLFILLFCALFVILIKKLLWLWHKNRNIHAHPQDKFNVAMRRRIGLIYRTGCLLVMKLSTDALFIAYVNSTQNSWWSYPFGISCTLL